MPAKNCAKGIEIEKKKTFPSSHILFGTFTFDTNTSCQTSKKEANKAKREKNFIEESEHKKVGFAHSELCVNHNLV